MTPCTAVLPAYREPRTGSVLRARRGRTEQRRDGTDRPLSRPCEVGRRGRAGRPEWGTLYASGGVRQPSASEPSRNTRPVRCPVMGRHAGHQRRDGEQTKQSVSARAAGIATPATPPLLKSVDGDPFGGPVGIFTRLDQHVCYTMDGMASSVDTFNPKVTRSRLARPTNPEAFLLSSHPPIA